LREHVVVVASTTNIVVATMWREILKAEGIAAELGGTTMSTSVYAMIRPTRRAGPEREHGSAGITPVRCGAAPPTRTAR